ncbi:MAG TPA: glutamine amidotransferase, partial [Gemmataceae bacterium]|nr:glutamine amidotransferase [Gemmataceae bacterium]
GTWLHEMGQRHGTESNLRGLILLSDGADNGTTFATLEQAALLRGICPIFPFGLGRPTTTSKSNDIELTDIRVEPDPIPVKGKIKVTGYVNAPGFENSSVGVSLWIQETGAKEPRLAAAAKHVLKKTQGNEVVVTCDAPETAGEIKITLKIPPLDGEVSVLNNEISTYATVTKEGVSILWVEGRKRLESVFAIRHALRKDIRFRPYFIELVNDTRPGPEVADWFDLDKRHYDVIVIGDITAKRLGGGDPDVFSKIRAMVEDRGTGLLMMGGYQTLGGEDSDWETNAAPLAAILPVTVGREHGQSAARVRMLPTQDGLDYLLRLDDKNDDAIWNKIFDPLEGFNNLGDVRKEKPDSTVFARGEADNEPLLVGATRGKGRVLVFAGDTTWMAWRRTPEALPAYERFWKQMMLYLAHQENMDGAVQITLDKRRVAAGSSQRLAFTLKARGKNGLDVKNPRFSVTVTSPGKEKTEVPVALDGGEYRGYFQKTNVAGDYRLEASVQGKDAEGNELSTQPSVAHFLGFAQDREMLRPAADHEFLTRIAGASGGQFALADERKLAGVLEELLSQRDAVPRARIELWPDWRRHPPSDALGDQISTLWNSTALPCFLAFVTLLCSEWYLRRRWGLV